MHADTIGDLILSEMEKYSKGTIFTNSDFYNVGKRSAIKTALFRLEKNGSIFRLIDGYYTIPYYSTILKKYSYPTADQLALKIADKNVWKIAPNGILAMNQVGLSTQVPTVYEYVSDGPYRVYEYMNKEIKFKHTANRSITKFSLPVNLIVQSLKMIGKDNVTQEQMLVLRQFYCRYVNEDILNESKSVAAWIYEVIKEIVR